MQKRFSLLFTFLFFISFSLAAQEIVKDFEVLVKKAERAREIGDYYSAIDYYEDALKADAKAHVKKELKFNAMYELASLHRLTRNYVEAEKYYKIIYKQFPGAYPDSKFYYALMLKRNGHCDSAKTIFEEVDKSYRGDNAQMIREQAEIELEGCQLKEKFNHTVDTATKVIHLPDSFNSAYSDFSPVLLSDSQMVFSSLRSDTVIELPSGKKLNNDQKSKFFLATFDSDTWVMKRSFVPQFQKNKYELANGTFSPDKERFYFNQCRWTRDQKMICELYVSQKKDGHWGNPQKLNDDINLKGYTATQPAVGTESRHGYKVVYFVSDRPGGKGGYDIWFTIFNEKRNRYEKPRNAGRDINTAFDEMTPYYDETKRQLFFSSDGWPGVGGLDVFKARGETNRYNGDPENLGLPINSSADDLYFSMNFKTGRGFVVSNRVGIIPLRHKTCCDDIFEVLIEPPVDTIFNGNVFSITGDSQKELDTGKVLKGAIVKIYKVKGEKNEIDQLRVSKENPDIKKLSKIKPEIIDTVDNNGQFEVTFHRHQEYFITIEHEGHLSYVSQKFRPKNLKINGGFLDSKFFLKKIPLKPIIIENIYYSFDKAELRESSKTVIDTTILKLMLENPSLLVEIGSHTDSKGSDEYNLDLSQRRAQSVVDYLVANGISKDRLIAKGYGETKPIAPNTNPDGSDNPEGRQKNRRTEFRIVGELNGVSKIIYKE